MHKIWLIIKREYLSRVKKRSFIVMTILGPLLFAGVLIVPVWLASRDGEEKIIEVLDESGYFVNNFEANGSIKYRYINNSLEVAKSEVPLSNHFGLLYIPPFSLENPQGITFFSENNPGFELVGGIRISKLPAPTLAMTSLFILD